MNAPIASNSNLEELINELQTSGVTFCIQYVGSVVVEKSINSLCADRQAEVARGCMRFVIREAMPSVIKEAKVQNEGEPNTYLHGSVLSHNGDVDMNVSSQLIILIDPISVRLLHRFKVQDVSILSPGSEELRSFFCFVAKMSGKDGQWVRKCFVFKAKDDRVMTDLCERIALAFRLNAINRREETNTTDNPSLHPPTTLPTPKIPEIFVSPDTLHPPELPPRLRHSTGTDQQDRVKREMPKAIGMRISRSSSTSPKDYASVNISADRYKEIVRGLDGCAWYHGTIPRMEAISRVRKNGQFLVRRSPNIMDDQFVLTGMHDGVHRHVFLINREGQVLTTIGEFNSIVHLINYFHRSQQPLILQDVQLVLHKPVSRMGK